ncbi:MAG: hypothetical protein ACO3FQ_05535 [Terrimicrobiaceae bacterium]
MGDFTPVRNHRQHGKKIDGPRHRRENLVMENPALVEAAADKSISPRGACCNSSPGFNYPCKSFQKISGAKPRNFLSLNFCLVPRQAF